MLIASAAELLGEAERLAAEGPAEGEAEKEKAAPAANGAADPPSGLEQVEGEGEEGDEEAGMTPVQTAQHYAMRNLMNAGGWPARGCVCAGRLRFAAWG